MGQATWVASARGRSISSDSSAAAARDYVRELEGLGVQALWIPESLGSKEIFAHAGLLLAASERLIIASGIANMWARDATAMANGQRALTEAYPGRSCSASA